MAAISDASRHLEVEFGDIHEQNLEQLKKLNLAIFPVRYNQKFYKNMLNTPNEFTQFAYWNGFVVGAICCRLEPPSGPGPKKLYIMTIGVLAAYRRRNIGRALLEKVLENIKEYPEDIVQVYLHVQTNNDSALDFYKAFGFEITETIQNYYKRIEPPDCHVLSKAVTSKGAGSNPDPAII